MLEALRQITLLGKSMSPPFIAYPDLTHVFLRWEAGEYTAVSFYVPDNWQAGRIWVSNITVIAEAV